MNDAERIIQCVSHYVEGWYEANSARMDTALSGHLVKRRVVSRDEVWDVNKEWMLQATQEGRGALASPQEGIKAIEILDQTATMATVKLRSNEFVDYIHLAQCDGDWLIINALWDYIEKPAP